MNINDVLVICFCVTALNASRPLRSKNQKMLEVCDETKEPNSTKEIFNLQTSIFWYKNSFFKHRKLFTQQQQVTSEQMSWSGLFQVIVMM